MFKKNFRVQLILIFIIIISAGILAAQEASPPQFGWKNEIIGNLNLTQASFSNWEQGGENTLAWQVNLTTRFTLEQEKYNWKNSGKFTLGFAKVAGSAARKSSDEINLETVYTRKFSKPLNPFVSATAKTQFLSGFRYPDDATKIKISKFLDPGYFTQSVGVGYSPNEIVLSRLGFTLKETITSDFPVPFADDPDTPEIEKTKIEPGLSSITDLKKKFAENILLTSRLDVFADFKAFNRIDVLWENDLTCKLTKLVNVNLEFDLFYDRDISKRRQIRQVLSVGLSYTFL
jgi:hypothetical protein